jgi:hypothetical protein
MLQFAACSIQADRAICSIQTKKCNLQHPSRYCNFMYMVEYSDILQQKQSTLLSKNVPLYISEIYLRNVCIICNKRKTTILFRE